MEIMSEAERPHPHHGVHEIVERITEHHEQAARRHEEEALTLAAETAAFDLGSDIGHPTVGHNPVGYDIDSDLGTDKEPPELRAR